MIWIYISESAQCIVLTYTKFAAWISHLCILALLILVVPGGLFLLALNWIHKHWHTAR